MREKGKDIQTKTTFDFNFGLKKSQIESKSKLYFLSKIPYKPIMWGTLILFACSITSVSIYKVKNNESYVTLNLTQNTLDELGELEMASKQVSDGNAQYIQDVISINDKLEKSFNLYRYGGETDLGYLNIKSLNNQLLVKSHNDWDRARSMVEKIKSNRGEFERVLKDLSLTAQIGSEIHNINNNPKIESLLKSAEINLNQLSLLSKVIMVGQATEEDLALFSQVSEDSKKDLTALERGAYKEGLVSEYQAILRLRDEVRQITDEALNERVVAFYQSYLRQAEQLSYLSKEMQDDMSEYINSMHGDQFLIELYWYFFLVSFVSLMMLISLMSVSLREKHKKAARVAGDLQRNQNNDYAIDLLLKQIKPMADGDLTQRVYVSDKFVMQIAERIDDTRVVFASMVQQIKETATFIADSADKTDETSKKLLEVSVDQFNQMDSFIEKITMISHEMIEIAENAKSAQKNSYISEEVSVEGEMLVRVSIDKMNEIRVKIQESAKKIKKSSESAQAITEVVDLIRNITQQIEVLSLNAAIQAASSGDAGREFSIVAQEVKRLADDSKIATESILTLVQEVKEDINRAVDSMEDTTQEVVEGAKHIGNAGRSLKKIKDKSREVTESVSLASQKLIDQASDMASISHNIRDLQSTTEKSKEIVKETATQVEGLKEVAKKMLEKIKPYKIRR